MPEMMIYYSVIVLAVLCVLAVQVPLWRRKQRSAEEVVGPKQLQPVINELMQEFISTAQDIVRAIDAREQSLRELIREADERIGRWEDVCRREAAMPAPGRSALPKTQEKYADVFELQSQGLSPREIAEQLNLEMGKVELLCNLRQKM